MLFATLFLFTSTTTFWVLTLVDNGKQYQAVLIDHPEIPLGQKFMMANELDVGLRVATDWLASFSVRSVLSY